MHENIHLLAEMKFRDSVRQLMIKKQAADELNNALDDAMAEFGN